MLDAVPVIDGIYFPNHSLVPGLIASDASAYQIPGDFPGQHYSLDAQCDWRYTVLVLMHNKKRLIFYANLTIAQFGSLILSGAVATHSDKPMVPLASMR